MKKLIIIPAYNESASIEKTVLEIERYAPEFDYMIINDCSTDHTEEICRKNGFPVISLPVNLGIGGAVQTGYRYALEKGYDMAVQVDGDGQHDPAFLNKMADHLEQHDLDMVIGSRFIEKKGFQSSGMRRIGDPLFYAADPASDGKSYHRSDFRSSNGRQVGDKDVCLQLSGGLPGAGKRDVCTEAWEKVEEIPVVMRERSGGVSSISMTKSVYYMIKVTMAILIECIRKEETDEY